MTPKPPPLPPPPAAVPLQFKVIAVETVDDLERQVNEALDGGMRLEANTTQVSTIAGAVVLSQACTRDPRFDKRVRTPLLNQRIINAGGQV
jgi:hypothetical protein